MHYGKIAREVKLLTFNSCAPKALQLDIYIPIERVEQKNTAKPSQQSKTTHNKIIFLSLPFRFIKLQNFLTRRGHILTSRNYFNYNGRGINPKCLQEINLIFEHRCVVFCQRVFRCCVVLFILFFVYFKENKNQESSLCFLSATNIWKKIAYGIQERIIFFLHFAHTCLELSLDFSCGISLPIQVQLYFKFLLRLTLTKVIYVCIPFVHNI